VVQYPHVDGNVTSLVPVEVAHWSSLNVSHVVVMGSGSTGPGPVGNGSTLAQSL